MTSTIDRVSSVYASSKRTTGRFNAVGDFSFVFQSKKHRESMDQVRLAVPLDFRPWDANRKDGVEVGHVHTIFAPYGIYAANIIFDLLASDGADVEFGNFMVLQGDTPYMVEHAQAFRQLGPQIIQRDGRQCRHCQASSKPRIERDGDLIVRTSHNFADYADIWSADTFPSLDTMAACCYVCFNLGHGQHFDSLGQKTQWLSEQRAQRFSHVVRTESKPAPIAELFTRASKANYNFGKLQLARASA